MEDQKVSIIIPTYNYGHLIDQTLNCVVNQDFKNWEALIIDDGSTDDTERILDNFVKADNRFKYIKQKNKGVSAARNVGIMLAKGEYIQLLDADDLISKKKISLQYEALKNNDFDISLVSTHYFESSQPKILYSNSEASKSELLKMINVSGYEIIKSYINANQTVVQSPLFRKQIFNDIGYFREDMHYLEDWDFWLRCAFHNYSFSFLDNVDAFALVRIHPESASKQSNNIIEAEGRLRGLINGYLESSSLNTEQQIQLKKLNNKLLINTFKHLMAKTSFSSLNAFRRYYKSIGRKSLFYAALLKSLNLKRKRN